jgi:hypothetical protein
MRFTSSTVACKYNSSRSQAQSSTVFGWLTAIRSDKTARWNNRISGCRTSSKWGSLHSL